MSVGISEDERQAYRAAVDETLARCAPLPLSYAFGSVIAGRPITYDFTDAAHLMGWHLRASKDHPDPAESYREDDNNYGCLFPVHVAGCSPVMPNGRSPPVFIRLADEGCGSEHDNSRDECCHAGIRQDFIENSAHCIPMCGVPYSRRHLKATPAPWRKGEILRARAVKCA